jgi:hypothetical protein
MPSVKGESIGNFTGSRTAAEVEYGFRCCALQPWVSHFSIDITIGFLGVFKIYFSVIYQSIAPVLVRFGGLLRGVGTSCHG